MLNSLKHYVDAPASATSCNDSKYYFYVLQLRHYYYGTDRTTHVQCAAAKHMCGNVLTRMHAMRYLCMVCIVRNDESSQSPTLQWSKSLCDRALNACNATATSTVTCDAMRAVLLLS